MQYPFALLDEPVTSESRVQYLLDAHTASGKARMEIVVEGRRITVVNAPKKGE